MISLFKLIVFFSYFSSENVKRDTGQISVCFFQRYAEKSLMQKWNSATCGKTGNQIRWSNIFVLNLLNRYPSANLGSLEWSFPFTLCPALPLSLRQDTCSMFLFILYLLIWGGGEKPTTVVLWFSNIDINAKEVVLLTLIAHSYIDGVSSHSTSICVVNTQTWLD